MSRDELDWAVRKVRNVLVPHFGEMFGTERARNIVCTWQFGDYTEKQAADALRVLRTPLYKSHDISEDELESLAARTMLALGV